MSLFFIYVGAALVGAAMGSFAVAQVWRLRAHQLVMDDKMDRPVDRSELKRLRPLTTESARTDRSRCLSCGATLKWYDLIPIISWLSLGGKCRYCGKSIGWTEFIAEVAVAALFVLSVAFWPEPLNDIFEIGKLLLWLIAIVTLTINFIYDAKWSLLVSGLNWLLIVCGLVFSGISLIQHPDTMMAVWSLVGAVFILGGLYAILWLVSRGRWVGEGDIYLGTGLALFLMEWPLAFIALFLANLIGTLAVLPQLMSGKLGRQSQIPFGPLLIAGAILTWFIGPFVADWYQSLVF